MKKLILSNLGLNLSSLENLAIACNDLPNLTCLDISSNNLMVEHLTWFLQKIDGANQLRILNIGYNSAKSN